MALIPAARRRARRAGRAARGHRPQPRGPEDAEAGRAAGPDPARRGLLLRRDRRADRLEPDESQSLPGRGPRALPRLPLPQRGRRPLRRAAAVALRFLRRRDEPARGAGRARAPARLRPLPGDDARLPGGPAVAAALAAAAAAVPLAARTRPRCWPPACSRGCRDAAASRIGRHAGRRRRRHARRRHGGAGEAARDLRRNGRWRGGLRRRRRRAGAARPRPAPKPALERPSVQPRPPRAKTRRSTTSRRRRRPKPRRASPTPAACDRSRQEAAPVSAEPSAATAGAVEYERRAPAPRTERQQRSRAHRELERLRRRGVRAVSDDRSATRCGSCRA